MTPKKKVEFLIIGQGLAGSLLGWRLIQQGHSVLLLDPCLTHTASRTAAGLINPVTGKRLVKTDHVEQYLTAAKELYAELANFFALTFLHEREQVRLFQSDAELNQWNKRKNQAEYAPFLAERFNAKDKKYLKETSLGGFKQQQCAYLDTVVLLDHLRDFFLHQGCFIKAQMDLSELNISSSFVEWHGHTADKIIFCDGYHLQYNPWFSWLPLQPVQGDILTLKTDQPLPNEIVQFGKWLLPLANGQLKLGASWQWQPLDEKPNEKAALELLDACYPYFPHLRQAQRLEHNVGIRPGTRDKHPFLGQHPEQSNLLVFNGFGSKGSLLIPWHAERFLRYLTHAKPLPTSADINRYTHDYFTR